VHADLDPVQGVGVDLLIRRADHNRGLQRHDRFVVFERTMEGNRFALCFDLEQKNPSLPSGCGTDKPPARSVCCALISSNWAFRLNGKSAVPDTGKLFSINHLASITPNCRFCWLSLLCAGQSVNSNQRPASRLRTPPEPKNRLARDSHSSILILDSWSPRACPEKV